MEEMAEKTFHSTTIQAATVAKDAGAKKLVVGHYSSRFPSVDFYLDQIKTIFPQAMLAYDGDVIEI
jgi:ribonuclease Z